MVRGAELADVVVGLSIGDVSASLTMVSDNSLAGLPLGIRAWLWLGMRLDVHCHLDRPYSSFLYMLVYGLCLNKRSLPSLSLRLTWYKLYVTEFVEEISLKN